MIYLLVGIVLGGLLLLGMLFIMHWISKRGSSDAFSAPERWILTALLLTPIILSFKFGAGLLSLFVVLVFGTLVGLLWAPRWGELLAFPFTSALTGGNQQVEARPYYSRANGLRKRGQYLEALDEVEMQLLRFPDDFEGMMLMAEIQEENLKDRAAAMATLLQLESSPSTEVGNQLVVRLKRIQLLLSTAGGELEAQQLLQQIILEHPGSEAAQIARQRLAHMPSAATASAGPSTLEQDPDPDPVSNADPDSGPVPSAPTRLRVPVNSRRVGLGTNQGVDLVKKPDHAAEATALVRHLEQHPRDWDSRERLAVIYAQELHDAEAARDQLRYLLNLPDSPERKVVLWLNKLTDLHISIGDMNTARNTLLDIIKRFPNSLQAERAQMRIDKLGIEARQHRATPTLSLEAKPEGAPNVAQPQPQAKWKLNRSKHIALPTSIRPATPPEEPRS